MNFFLDWWLARLTCFSAWWVSLNALVSSLWFSLKLFNPFSHYCYYYYSIIVIKNLIGEWRTISFSPSFFSQTTCCLFCLVRGQNLWCLLSSQVAQDLQEVATKSTNYLEGVSDWCDVAGVSGMDIDGDICGEELAEYNLRTFPLLPHYCWYVSSREKSIPDVGKWLAIRTTYWVICAGSLELKLDEGFYCA